LSLIRYFRKRENTQ